MSAQNFTPELEAVIRAAIEQRLSDVHTALPGRITSVDVPAGKCSVQPLLKRRYYDGAPVNLPIVSGVPLLQFRAGNAFVSLPVKVGDTVMLVFSERSLDTWLSIGGLVDPKDKRKHHLSDAVAIPGLYPFSSPPEGATADDIIIRNADSKVTIRPTGKFLFAGPVYELMQQLVDLTEKVRRIADELSTATTNTIYGPMKLNNFSEFATLEGEVDTIKGNITELKG